MSRRLTVSNPTRKHLEDIGNLTMDAGAGFKCLSVSSVTAVPGLAMGKSIGHRALGDGANYDKNAAAKIVRLLRGCSHSDGTPPARPCQFVPSSASADS
jgi:hypothetical protein